MNEGNQSDVAHGSMFFFSLSGFSVSERIHDAFRGEGLSLAFQPLARTLDPLAIRLQGRHGPAPLSVDGIVVGLSVHQRGHVGIDEAAELTGQRVDGSLLQPVEVLVTASIFESRRLQGGGAVDLASAERDEVQGVIRTGGPARALGGSHRDGVPRALALHAGEIQRDGPHGYTRGSSVPDPGEYQVEVTAGLLALELLRQGEGHRRVRGLGPVFGAHDEGGVGVEEPGRIRVRHEAAQFHVGRHVRSEPGALSAGRLVPRPAFEVDVQLIVDGRVAGARVELQLR